MHISSIVDNKICNLFLKRYKKNRNYLNINRLSHLIVIRNYELKNRV